MVSGREGGGPVVVGNRNPVHTVYEGATAGVTCRSGNLKFLPVVAGGRGDRSQRGRGGEQPRHTLYGRGEICGSYAVDARPVARGGRGDLGSLLWGVLFRAEYPLHEAALLPGNGVFRHCYKSN